MRAQSACSCRSCRESAILSRNQDKLNLTLPWPAPPATGFWRELESCCRGAWGGPGPPRDESREVSSQSCPPCPAATPLLPQVRKEPLGKAPAAVAAAEETAVTPRNCRAPQASPPDPNSGAQERPGEKPFDTHGPSASPGQWDGDSGRPQPSTLFVDLAARAEDTEVGTQDRGEAMRMRARGGGDTDVRTRRHGHGTEVRTRTEGDQVSRCYSFCCL